MSYRRSTPTERTYLERQTCTTCGVGVIDTTLHDQWHTNSAPDYHTATENLAKAAYAYHRKSPHIFEKTASEDLSAALDAWTRYA